MNDIILAHVDLFYDILRRNNITDIEVENTSSMYEFRCILKRNNKICVITGISPWIVEIIGGYMCGYSCKQGETAMKDGILMLLDRYRYPSNMC